MTEFGWKMVKKKNAFIVSLAVRLSPSLGVTGKRSCVSDGEESKEVR